MGNDGSRSRLFLTEKDLRITKKGRENVPRRDWAALVVLDNDRGELERLRLCIASV